VLRSRHGECTEIEHAATADEMPVIKGRAVEVRVPDRNLAMVFATRELCRTLAGK
jgi:hypothetical protein